jgi:hypothetical protein
VIVRRSDRFLNAEQIPGAEFRSTELVNDSVLNKLNPLFETEFSYDSDTSLTGKSTLFAVCCLDRFIRQCSANCTRNKVRGGT